MRKSVKILLIATMVALLPLRSIAAVMTVFCPDGTQQIAASHPQAQAQTPGQGHNDEASRCSLCVTHCASGAFVSDAGRPAIMPGFADSRISLVERSAPAFIPDQLDRPPLALLR